MSDPLGVEKTPLSQTLSVTSAGGVSGDKEPLQGQMLREESEASREMAAAGEGSSEAVATPRPPLSEERDSALGPEAGSLTCQGVGGGDRSPVVTEAGQEEAPPLAEGLGAVATSMATGSDPTKACGPGEPPGRDGETGPETCGAERSVSGVMAAETEAADAARCATAPMTVGEVKEGVEENMEVEEKMEVEEQEPGGDDKNMAEGVKMAGFRSLRLDVRMNPLEAIQMELDSVNAQADRAFQHLENKFGRMRRHYLERRNYIIQNIPGFWAAAFRNHPQLSPLIRGQDAQMLRYITNLEVKNLRHPRSGCKFKFFFRRNPYFRNKLIVKEYEIRATGGVVSLSTPIIWRRGHEPQSFIRRNQDMVCSFFTWFSDHSLPESDKIAEIIKEDLWPNPLQYYLLRDGVRRARRRPIREPVEIPRPFGCQSG